MSSSGSSNASSSRGSTPEAPEHRGGSPVFIPPSPEVVAAYDQLMSSRLPVPLPLPVQPSAEAAKQSAGLITEKEVDGGEDVAEDALGRPMTKAEKQNAKKKRRKERERQLRAEAEAVRAAAQPEEVKVEDETVPFRLFSDVRPVSLVDVEWYPTTPNPRLTPLPKHIRERISRLAADAAVTPPEISCDRCEPSECLTLIPGQEMRAKHEMKDKRVASTLPSVFVAMGEGGKPGMCVAAPHLKMASGQESKSKRRRRAYRPFPAPAFWEPEEGCEGRSAGYFYGWSV